MAGTFASNSEIITSENSAKLRHARSHNIRTSGDIKYLTGDSVYFRRLDNKSWHGPAKALGQDRQQVLIKNGSIYNHNNENISSELTQSS